MASHGSHTWHYGLVARYWAEHKTDGPEIAYFRDQIRRYGTPALDAGCGTGRLLIPFLHAGLDADGCDVSPDMLRLCRDAAVRQSLEPQLYQQPLHELDLPRTYQTIVACGALGLGVTRTQDLQALERFYRHLTPDGTLLMDVYLPYGDAKTWQHWPKQARDRLPEPWPDGFGTVPPPPDGSGFEIRARVLALDPAEQRVTRQIRVLLWQDGTIAEEEIWTLTENLYFRHEMQTMVQRAGFAIEAVHGPHTPLPATADDDVIVLIARKIPAKADR